MVALRTGRLDQSAERVGLAFSDVKLLQAALGEDQPWTRLSERALRAMLRPLGITMIQRDPLFVGPRVVVTDAPRSPVADPRSVVADARPAVSAAAVPGPAGPARGRPRPVTHG